MSDQPTLVTLKPAPSTLDAVRDGTGVEAPEGIFVVMGRRHDQAVFQNEALVD
jgi:hypothetical protein